MVASPGQGKDADFYLHGLASVFGECHRVPKEDGLLAFSFHHQDPTAWASVLQAVLNAGFGIRATYPVVAEMGRSVPIQGQEAMEYDAIVVCRKRSPAPAVEWQDLEDLIWDQAREAQTELMQANGSISRMETSVIVLGKCIEFFSQYYPNVVRDGVTVSASEVVAGMRGLIDELAALSQPYTVGFQPRLIKEDDAQ